MPARAASAGPRDSGGRLPANLPALFVPLAPTPAVPAALARARFTRTARSLGAHGHVRHAFAAKLAGWHIDDVAAWRVVRERRAGQRD